MVSITQQLEALGELLSHSYVKNLPEDKPPYSTRKKIYLAKLADSYWNVTGHFWTILPSSNYTRCQRHVCHHRKGIEKSRNYQLSIQRHNHQQWLFSFTKMKENLSYCGNVPFAKGTATMTNGTGTEPQKNETTGVTHLKLCCKCLWAGYASKSCQAGIKPCFLNQAIPAPYVRHTKSKKVQLDNNSLRKAPHQMTYQQQVQSTLHQPSPRHCKALNLPTNPRSYWSVEKQFVMLGIHDIKEEYWSFLVAEVNVPISTSV